MPTFAWGKYTFGVGLAALVQQALFLGPRLSDFDNLGTTTVLRDQRMADIINRMINEFLEGIPALGITTSTITLASTTNSYAVPTAMKGMAIQKIVYSPALINGPWSAGEVLFVAQPTVANFPLTVLNGTTTAQFPTQWSFDETAQRILIWPYPALNGAELLVYYQQAPTVITSTNVNMRDSIPVTINELPSRWQNVFALRIAAEVVVSLDRGIAADLENQYQGGLQQIQAAFTDVQAASRPTVQGFGMGAGPVNFNSLYAGSYRF